MKKKIKKKWLMYLLCLTCLLIPASVLSVSAREEGNAVELEETQTEVTETETEKETETETEKETETGETNPEQNKLNIPVTIVWEDAENRDGQRPEEINVWLKKGTENCGETIKEKEDKWEATVEMTEKPDESWMIMPTMVEGYTCTKEIGKDNDGNDKITITYSYREPLKREEKQLPSCETAGHQEGYTCSICKKHFEDKDGKKEIPESAWTIPAVGHEITGAEQPATDTKDGKLTYSCQKCGYEKESYIIPKKKLTIVLGKSANIMSDGDASKCSFKVADKYKDKKYFKVNQKTGKITTVQYYKEKLPSSIPVEVTTGGKTYTTTVQVKIPKLTKKNVKVKRTTEGSVYVYRFTYNVPKAKRIKVRIKGRSNKQLNQLLDKLLGNPKINKNPTISMSRESARKFGKKVQFQIRVDYGGGNWSETIKRSA